MNSILRILAVVLIVRLTSSTQLFYPVEVLEDQWCGPYKECPLGTQCMRTYDRSEPFSCFLPQFGSTFSFVEESRHPTPNPTAPPVWLLAFASFGILCLVGVTVWITFYAARRLIVGFVVPSLRCQKEKRAQSINAENPGYEGGETAAKTTSGNEV